MKIVTFDLKMTMQGTVAPSIIEDCVDAFQELGHDVWVIDLIGLGATPMERLMGLERRLLEIRPDFVFTLNDYSLTPELLRRLGIRYVSWFGDNPFHFLKKEYISPYYTIFVWDKTYLQELKDFGIDHVYYLPLCTNPKVFRKIRLEEEERKRYGCNLSFIGGSFYSHYKRYKEIRHPLIRAMIGDVIRIQSMDPLIDISSIIADVEKEYTCRLEFKEPEDKVKVCLEYAAMAMYRKGVLEDVAHLGLSIYGDDGWRDLLDGKEGIRFFGWVDPKKEVPLIYNASKINLNITKSQARTGLNWRVYDILACGAFMLTDYRKDFDELFDEGEIVSYKNKEDLRALAIHFLEREDERMEIARRGMDRVVKEHTFKVRMKRLIDAMEGE